MFAKAKSKRGSNGQIHAKIKHNIFIYTVKLCAQNNPEKNELLICVRDNYKG